MPFKTIKKFFLVGLISFLIAVCAYLVLQLTQVVSVPYVYETVIAYELSDSISSDGYVIFDETFISGSGNVYYLVEDGERVSAGQAVAEIYDTENQVQIRHQIELLEKDIELLRESEKVSNLQVSSLLSDRTSSIYDVLDAIDNNDYSELKKESSEYVLTQNKIEVLIGETENFTQQITEMLTEKESLEANLASTQTVISPTNGYFISEAMAEFLTEEQKNSKDASIADFETTLKKEPTFSESVIGKVVSSYTWQFVGNCPTEQSERFTVGNTLNLSFPNKSEEIYPATVVSVETTDENENAKIILECEYMGAEILSLGREVGQVIFKSYEGLRVSTSALRLIEVKEEFPESSAQSESSNAESVSDENENSANAAEDASLNSDYIMGVYIKNNNFIKFEPIEILFQTPEYVIVPYQTIASNDEGVKLYDQVVVSGLNVKDGKLL